MKSFAFTLRLTAVVIAVVVLASVLTVVLNDLKFRRVMREQATLVNSFIVADLRSSIEDAMNLGMKLAALENTQSMIERRQQASTDITGISVTDTRGIVLFDTDRKRIGTTLAAGYGRVAGDAVAKHIWSRQMDGAAVVGATLMNSFGQPEGSVVVRASEHDVEARASAILTAMIRAAVIAGLFTCAAAIAIIALLTRGHRAWFAKATAQILASQDSAAHAAATAAMGKDELLDFASVAADTNAALARARHDIAALEPGAPHAA